MASEADSSPTLDSFNTEESSNRQQKKTSDLWTHTRAPDEDEDTHYKRTRLMYCKHCTTTVHCSKSTTNFRNHLRAKHNIHLEKQEGPIHTKTRDQLRHLYVQLRDTEQSNDIDTLALQNALNREAIAAALISLITVRRLPFRIVEWPEFHVFCRVLNPEVKGYITTAHSTVNNMIQNTFTVQKDIVRKKLQTAISKVHLSLDIWTSPNRHLLLGVCAHFVDRNERLKRGLLALRTTPSHSGEDQFQTLLPILQDYGIIQRLGAIVADNASTNDVLCRTIQKYLQEEYHMEWKSVHQRIRCNGHIVHLAVEAFLFQDLIQEDELMSYDIEDERGLQVDLNSRSSQFRALGALGKLHNIVVHTRSSPGRTKDFLTLAQRRIPLDNRTRWNSWHQMLQVALEHESAIDLYTKKHTETLGEDFLTPQDWTSLRTTYDFLQIFKRVTLETQGHDATISSVLFSIDILVRHFKQSLIRILFTFKSFSNVVR